MKRKEQEVIKEQELKKDLLNKIKTYESKLLAGGKNVIDHTNAQERKLAERRAMIAEEQRLEKEMQKRLEKQEENNLDINNTFSNLQQEVDFKTKKLKKYFAKYQSLKEEIKDLTEQNAREREELQNTETELQRDLKLRQLIIENFIPPDEREKLNNKFYYDQDECAWKTKTVTKETKNSEHELQMEKRPLSAFGLNRAMTNFSRNAAQTLNPRFHVRFRNDFSGGTKRQKIKMKFIINIILKNYRPM